MTFLKSCANDSSNDVKLLKTKLSKVIQSCGFFGRLLGPLLRVGLPLVKSGLNPFFKSVLILLSTKAVPAADAGIHKNSQDLD